jgi:hypothetical protein
MESKQLLEDLKKIEDQLGILIPIAEVYAHSNKTKKEIDETIDILLREGSIYIPRRGYVQIVKRPIITKNLIESELMDCQIEHKGSVEPSKILCDRIEYVHERGKDMSFEHYLKFYKRGEPIFKILLPNDSKDKEFENINEALESCGVSFKIELVN